MNITKLTRNDCAELYTALAAIEGGLGPTNTITAADNINALHPICVAHDKGKNAFQRAARKLEKDVRSGIAKREDADERLETLADELNEQGEQSVDLELKALKISDEDIAVTKMRPKTLAALRRLLPP